MRKRFQSLTPLIAVFILALVVGLAFAQSTREATWGYKDSTNTYRLTATRDTNGAYISVSEDNVGWIPGYEVFTTGGATNRLAAKDSGRRLIDASGHAGAHYILPTAVAGLEYEVCTSDVNYVTLDTNSTDDTIHFTVAGAALAAGDSLLSTGQAGDCVRVTCGSDTNWYVTSMGAFIWTDNGTN